MCGIFGSINLPISVKQTSELLFHRGPDAQTEWKYENVCLQHFRLSILDLEGGAQPMHYLDRYVIVFNGEIYNHLNVRQKLSLSCKSNSDTETILVAYHNLGPSCLDYFDGMFAFCIYDKESKILFFARDRAGKKPLYYYFNDDKFCFSSEINALQAIVKSQINNDNILSYLKTGIFYKNATPYQNIQELEAGNYLEISAKSLNIQTTQWWSILKQYKTRNKDSYYENLEEVERLLKEGVKNRVMSSDLEVGSFLSGGIDSGLVTAMACEFKSVPLKTFTVRFNGQYDESMLAKLVSEKYGTEHTVIDINFDSLKNDVFNIVSNYGEPFMDSSAIPSYYVSKAAKEHITVVLNGDGADELFGGYRRYVPYKHFDLFTYSDFTKSTISALNNLLPKSHNKKSKYNYIKRLFTLASQSGLEQYLSATTDVFAGYNHRLLQQYKSPEGIEEDLQKIIEVTNSSLASLLCMDFETILFGDLLPKMDIATMANSLEGRSPFLCKGLLEFVPGLTDDRKIQGFQTKRLLRDIAKKYLPPELINQPKRGFEIPLKNWVDFELNEMIRDYLTSTNAINKDYVKPRAIEAILDNKLNIPKEKRAKMLWSLFCLEIWNEKRKLLLKF